MGPEETKTHYLIKQRRQKLFVFLKFSHAKKYILCCKLIKILKFGYKTGIFAYKFLRKKCRLKLLVGKKSRLNILVGISKVGIK